MDARIRRRQNSNLSESSQDPTDRESEEGVVVMVVKNAGSIGVCIVSGLVFGLAVEKGRVFDPDVIQGQMLMEKFIMVKMFASAVASGMFCLSVISILPQTHGKFVQATKNFTQPLMVKGYLSALVGGAIMGMGIALCGSCPGMVFAQIGSFTPHALYTLMGGFTGVLLYSSLHPYFKKYLKPRPLITKPFLHESLGDSYHNYSFTLSSIIGAGVMALELWVPWSTELTVANDGGDILTVRAWPPVLSGVIIGCLQVPILLAVQDTLGSATSYCVLMSQFTLIKAVSFKLRYLVQYVVGIDNWWQVSFMGAVLGGAYISASMSHSLGSAHGVGVAQSFLGGVCMLFGARLAGGCTSGHGLSGIALLSKMSFVAVPAMFAAGIGTACTLRFLNLI